jgi:hypothetical protein
MLTAAAAGDGNLDSVVVSTSGFFIGKINVRMWFRELTVLVFWGFSSVFQDGLLA